MLVNCPRCGFSQPKDRYCAQCGVDMLSFKPKEPSSLAKIFRSGVFQVIMLVIFAVGAGTFIIKERQEQRWVQRISRTQGVSKNIGTVPPPSQTAQTEQASTPEKETKSEVSLANLENQSIEVPNDETAQVATTKAAATTNAANSKNVKSTASENAADTSSVNIKLNYIEIPIDTLNRWESDSARLGLYQNLGEYSAGILTDFRKRSDLNFLSLKNSERKLGPGQSDTNLSGTMSEDGGRLIGLATKIDVRSLENSTIHGSITVTRTAKQARENYPAEFDLPKGAVFFLIGSIKRQQFVPEMNQLTMPPFQILRSPDFRSQKSEFVIVVEPEFR